MLTASCVRRFAASGATFHGLLQIVRRLVALTAAQIGGAEQCETLGIVQARRDGFEHIDRTVRIVVRESYRREQAPRRQIIRVEGQEPCDLTVGLGELSVDET